MTTEQKAAPPHDLEVPEMFVRLVGILAKRFKLMIVTTALVSLGVVGAYVSIPKTYEVAVQIQYLTETPEEQASQVFERIGKLFGSSGEETIDTQIQIITSQAILKESLERLQIIPVGASPETAQAIVQRFKPDVTARKVGKTNIFELVVRAPKPEFAVQLANTMTDVYQLNDLRTRQRTDQALRSYLLEQIDSLEKKIREQKTQMDSFGDTESLTAEIKTLAQQKEQTLKSLAEERKNLEVERKALLARYTPQHPKVMEIDATLAYVNRILAGESTSDSASSLISVRPEVLDKFVKLQSRYQLTVRDLAQAQRQLEEGRKRAAENNAPYEDKEFLQRELTLNQEIYGNMKRRLSQVELTLGNNSQNVILLQEPGLPKRPVKPDPRRFLIVGLLLAILLPTSFTLIAESLDSTVGTIPELERVGSAGVLGGVPFVRNLSLPVAVGLVSGNGNGKEISDPALAGFREAFRTIRTKIDLRNGKKKGRTILITSTQPQEGKSVVSCNIARAFAETGLSVLLIDCNLRHPCINRYLDLPLEPGFLTALLKGADWKRGVLRLKNPSTFCILPAGGVIRNPLPLIEGDRFAEIIADAQRMFDVVVMDSPPAHIVSDAVAISRYTDGVVLVYSAGETSRAPFRRNLDQFRQASVPVIGLVMNHKRPVKLAAYPNYSYYAYGYPTKYPSEPTHAEVEKSRSKSSHQSLH